MQLNHVSNSADRWFPRLVSYPGLILPADPIRLLRTLALALVVLGRVCAADAPPEIADPFGLGPRLALLEHLRTEFKLAPAADATYEQLVELYWVEELKRHPRQDAADSLGDPAGVDEDALARDRVSRLREALKHEFHSQAAPEATEEELATTLRTLRDQRRNEAIADGAVQNTHGASTPPVKASPGEAGTGSKRPETTEKPLDVAASTPADSAAADLIGGWRARVLETWQRMKAIPADVPTAWPPTMAEIAKLIGAYRIRRGTGPDEYSDRPPAFEQGMQVWIQRTRLEGGSGAYIPTQVTRWMPALWIPEDTVWTWEHPARYRWARESEPYSLLVQLLIAGPGLSAERQKIWKERRKALTEAAGDPLGDQAFVDVCATAAKEGGFPDALPYVERISLRIEATFKQIDLGSSHYETAQDLVRGNAEDAKAASLAAEWRARLEQLSQQMLALDLDRRQKLEALLASMPGK